MITKNQLDSILSRSDLQSSYNSAISSTQYIRKTIFLSHAHTDRVFIERLKKFLQIKAKSVYIDWEDHKLPSSTEVELAIELKKKILSLDKFLMVLSPNSVNSVWCSWELGIADQKGNDNVAILPYGDIDFLNSSIVKSFQKMHPTFNYYSSEIENFYLWMNQKELVAQAQQSRHSDFENWVKY